MDEVFANPVWHALQQAKHRRFAVAPATGDRAIACRYPADVAPFVAVREPSPEALQELATLLGPGEQLWLIGDSFPACAELEFAGTLECLQMALPSSVEPPPDVEPGLVIELLSDENAAEMVALTDIAFPGFFRPRTCEMGAYYGVRQHGELIAMGGERLVLDGHHEISGVCTHPAHRNKGLAANLIWQVVRDHRRQGVESFLHVASANQRAIRLYLYMGFEIRRTVTLHRISRCSEHLTATP